MSTQNNELKKAGLKVNERVYIDDPPMLKPVPGWPGFDMKFGELESFFNGLEELIGLPASGFLKKVMRDEHCEREDSDEPFETANYHLKTTSRIEWWFVEDPENGLAENRIDRSWSYHQQGPVGSPFWNPLATTGFRLSQRRYLRSFENA